MLRWFYVAVHLLVEAVAARRDARIRFLRAEVEILRRKLGRNRVIPSPEDRARLLAIGRELNHDVADVIGIVTPLGVRVAYCLAFIHVGTRRVFLSPPTYHPNEHWGKQQARDVMMWFEENQIHARFLIHDRDTKFSAGFRRLFEDAGTRCLRTPLLAPDANAFAEAWIGALKRECLNHLLCFGLDHLGHICKYYVRFHNEHRPHQGLGNRTVPAAATGPPEELCPNAVPDVGTILCRPFLGGLLRHYYRDAA